MKQLLHEASVRAIYLTEDEHKQVLHYASILFLGFLLPHSTGNEFCLLQNVDRKTAKSSTSSKTPSFDPVACVLEMTLPERLGQFLTQTPSIQQNHASFELNTVTDPKVELAYHNFLERGLKPLLSARPLHREEVDLLHLIAMVICPWSTPTKKNLTPLARALVKHPLAPSFAVHHGHRVEWVEFLASQVVWLPSLSEDENYLVTKPLLQGALPHLQGSLVAFAARSTIPHVTSLAYAAWTAAVVQTKNLALLAQLWHTLLQQIVDNPVKYDCRHGTFPRRACRQFWPLLPNQPNGVNKHNHSDDNGFCHHCVCGQLLAGIFLHGTNRADFADMALSSVSDTIEWQMDAWAKDEDEQDKKPPTTPCLLAALLFAARNILLVTKQNDLEQEPIDTLVTSAVQLLLHPHLLVRQEAIRVLAEAFEYTPRAKSSAVLVLESIKQTKDSKMLEEMDFVVKYLVQASPGFAKELTSYLIRNMVSENGLNEKEAKMLETTALNNPRFIKDGYESILNQLSKNDTPTAIFMSLFSAMLSKRQTVYFAGPKTESDSLQLQSMLARRGNRWDQYRMACHAMVVGDFCLAALAFKSIANSPINERHFLWLSALEKIAIAEAMLTLHGSKAIPDASCQLHKALSYLHHLGTTASGKTASSFAFQTRYLFLRLDELDWITVIRQITRETRLTGVSPSKNTRHYQHLINAEKGFSVLGSRYLQLNQEYGVSFRSGRSTTCLLAHAYFCNFLSKATHSAFCDVFSAQKVQTDTYQRMSRLDLPMIKLLNELDGVIVQPMNTPMEPNVRAAAMLELLDAVLLVPTSFPRDFFSPRSRPAAQVRLSSGPAELTELGGKNPATIECHPSISFDLEVNGTIPLQFLQNARRPISCALLWYRFMYLSPMEDEDESNAVDGSAVEKSLPKITGPLDISILADGRYETILEMPPLAFEGFFMVQVKVGCRDSFGAEFELCTTPSMPEIDIHCTRSR